MLMRLAFVAAFASLLAMGLPALTAADSGLAPTPDTLAATVPPAGSLRVLLAMNGRVRFAPTTQSKIIVTLSARTEVEILGPAKVPGWFVIRFPREGNAWVHSKVLQSVDGGKRWRVTEDKARARDDSTLSAAIVGELQKGEILEDKGRLNGDWRAVYLPNAVAYISASVLDMPANIEQAKQDAAQRADNAASAWVTAQSDYARFYDALQKNPQNALVLDWPGLGKQFDAVIRDHRDPDTRLSAQRLKDGIVNVAAAAANLQKAKGITPVEMPSEIPVVTVAQQTPATQTPAGELPTPATPKITDVGDPTVPETLTVPGEIPSLVVPVPPAEVATVAPLVQKPVVAVAAAFAVEGFVTQQKFEGVGVSEVLIDDKSQVVAFLSIKAGKEIQLSEYYWRWVGVRGEIQKVDQAKHNLGYDVPLVIVDELSLSGN